MNILCSLGIHHWLFGYRYNWVVAKRCDRCDKIHYFYPDASQDNIVFYDPRQ